MASNVGCVFTVSIPMFIVNGHQDHRTPPKVVKTCKTCKTCVNMVFRTTVKRDLYTGVDRKVLKTRKNGINSVK
jgi:hypothetical protein